MLLQLTIWIPSKQFHKQCTHVNHKVYSNSDDSKYVAGFFNNLKKAFDTIDHSMLFEKLDHDSCKRQVQNVTWSEGDNQQPNKSIRNKTNHFANDTNIMHSSKCLENLQGPKASLSTQWSLDREPSDSECNYNILPNQLYNRQSIEFKLLAKKLILSQSVNKYLGELLDKHLQGLNNYPMLK